MRKVVGVVAGEGALPAIGVEAARGRGWDVVVVATVPREDLRRHATAYYPVPLAEYGRIVDTLLSVGARDVYTLGTFSPAVIGDTKLDAAARRVLARVRDRGNNALIAAFAHDMIERGLVLHSQLDLLHDLIVPAAFRVGEPLTEEQWADVERGVAAALVLTDKVDAGQTVVVKNGIVMALEAAEGTDETIRRGGRLAGPGAVVVKMKGRRATDDDLPVVGRETVEALAEVGASVLAVQGERTLLLHRDTVIERLERAGIRFVAVEGSGR